MYNCDNCHKSFTSKAGLRYHNGKAKKKCETDKMPKIKMETSTIGNGKYDVKIDIEGMNEVDKTTPKKILLEKIRILETELKKTAEKYYKEKINNIKIKIYESNLENYKNINHLLMQKITDERKKIKIALIAPEKIEKTLNDLKKYDMNLELCKIEDLEENIDEKLSYEFDEIEIKVIEASKEQNT